MSRLLAHRERRTETVEIGGVAIEIADEATVRQLVPDITAIDDLSLHLARDVDQTVVGDAVHNREACAGSLSRIHPIWSIDNMILARAWTFSGGALSQQTFERGRICRNVSCMVEAVNDLACVDVVGLGVIDEVAERDACERPVAHAK